MTSCAAMSWPKKSAQSRMVEPGRLSQGGYSTASGLRSKAIMVNAEDLMTKPAQAPQYLRKS